MYAELVQIVQIVSAVRLEGENLRLLTVRKVPFVLWISINLKGMLFTSCMLATHRQVLHIGPLRTCRALVPEFMGDHARGFG